MSSEKRKNPFESKPLEKKRKSYRTEAEFLSGFDSKVETRLGDLDIITKEIQELLRRRNTNDYYLEKSYIMSYIRQLRYDNDKEYFLLPRNGFESLHCFLHNGFCQNVETNDEIKQALDNNEFKFVDASYANQYCFVGRHIDDFLINHYDGKKCDVKFELEYNGNPYFKEIGNEPPLVYYTNWYVERLPSSVHRFEVDRSDTDSEDGNWDNHDIIVLYVPQKNKEPSTTE